MTADRKTGGLKSSENEGDNEITEVNNKTGNSIRESNENESDDDFGYGGLNGENGLRGNFNPKHDHDSQNNENYGRKGISDISESFPDRKNGLKASETYSALGISRFA